MINKIGFILPRYNYNYPLKNENKQQNSQSSIGISNVYYTPISFKGVESVEDKLLAIEELHCPVCGAQTISREKYEELSKNKDYIKQIYTEGAKRANFLAAKTLRKVHRKLGYVDR